MEIALLCCTGSHLEYIIPGRCFGKVLGPKAQIQKCWQALFIRGECCIKAHSRLCNIAIKYG